MQDKKNAFMHGLLLPSEIESLKKQAPDIVRGWIKHKLRLSIKVKKFANEINSQVLQMIKDNDAKIRRKLLKKKKGKHTKAFDKLKARYKKSGCAKYVPWSHLVAGSERITHSGEPI